MNTGNVAPVAFRTREPITTEHLSENHIVLCTLNAKYIHASLGLRYLFAHMQELTQVTALKEFTINQRPIDIVEQLLSLNPEIIGFGVYIWNISQTTEVIGLIRNVRPDITIVIGGPEVSYEFNDTEIFHHSDHLITGQADFAFRDLCRDLISPLPAPAKVIAAATPPVKSLVFPYDHYTDEDIANRVLYVEASRGCPFKCEFCLSALDKTAKPFDLPEFLSHMERLYQRGARQFKFVDRTFNLKAQNCIAILEFFLNRLDDDLFVHFEVIPDKLPAELKAALKKFPQGTLQFEVGIQSFNVTVQQTISRRQNEEKTLENLRWLRNETQAYIHADLIVGLPGETLESFAEGFNRLVSLQPHEIQVGILKRLRGTNIIRHTESYGMRYATLAPYQLLQNHDLDFQTMQQLQRFARYWDMIANSSRFSHSLPLILGSDPFNRFWRFCDWLYRESGQTHKISLARLFTFLYDGVNALSLHDIDEFTAAIDRDHSNSGEKKPPVWRYRGNRSETKKSHHAKRQQRLQQQVANN
jgi:radical SAM superfamily enzyme YgiQ (UPF0313 family)